MKAVFVAFLLLLSNLGFCQSEISLEDVAKNVKESNFTVLENAQRVYQAKETINFNKRNLLPRLNLWNLLSTPFDWRGAINIVQDIAPFLVPNNWFKLRQSEDFYLAYQEQYRALWANEVMTAKLLFINALRDQDFLKALKEQVAQMEDLIGIARSGQIFGATDPRTVRFLEIRRLELQEDARKFETLLSEEKKAISYALGLQQEEEISLSKIPLPEVEELEPLNYDTFIFRALDSSPELNQYDHLKEALYHTRKTIHFSFLGASQTSASIFTNIPVQDGLGFGAASSLRISNSEDHILDIQKESTREVLKKNLYNLVSNFNSYVVNIENQQKRRSLAQANYESIRTQLALGMSIDPLEMLKSAENEFDAKVSLINYKYEVVNTMEKLKRMIFNEDYKKRESKLQRLIEME
ncbi:MAG: TolC family protein [Bacteriovoracaceae bacterium]